MQHFNIQTFSENSQEQYCWKTDDITNTRINQEFVICTSPKIWLKLSLITKRTKLMYDFIWLRSVDRWGRAGTYGPRKSPWVLCHHPDLKLCMSELTALFFSKPPCNLTVRQEAACLQSLPVCNYLHSHFRRRMRPHCFLMEQHQGPEQVRRHSLSRDFWDVQAARCVDTPEPDVWGGTGTARQTLPLLRLPHFNDSYLKGNH